MIYLFIGVIIILLAYIEVIGESRRFSHNSLIGITIVLLLLAGLRDKVGADWDAYLYFYQNIEESDRVEIGYALINNAFSELSIPYNFFLLFVNGISLLLMCLFLEKNSRLPVIGALLFFCDLYLYFNLSGVRQAIAISITCYSITYAINKQFGRFLFAIFIAASFHLTALVFIVAYFLPRWRLNLRHLLFFSVAFFCGFYFLQSISNFITLYTLKDAIFYVEYQEKVDNLLGMYYVGIAKRTVLVGAVLVFFVRKITLNPNTRYYFNIYLFGLAIYMSTYMISPDIGVRMSSYFTILEIVIVGHLIYASQKITNRLLIVTLFSCMAIYKIFGYMSSEFYIYKSAVVIF